MNKRFSANQVLIFSITAIVVFLLSFDGFAGWLIYHKPEFKGKVIDSDTKEPIDGAVVVAIYMKNTLISGPGGGYSSIIKIRETLTDVKGEFRFPSYTTVYSPCQKNLM